MMTISSRQRVAVKGQIFGMRNDSCSCDPCDCDPCTCGDSLVPNIPSWRVSGYALHSGTFSGQDLSGQVILALAQPEHESSWDGWSEVILVRDDASSEQVHALLTLFETDLRGLPAEITAPLPIRRPVYRAVLDYRATGTDVHVQVTFSAEAVHLLREGTTRNNGRSWTYDGPMVLRGMFRTPSQ